eukprot:g5395.t1
MGRLQTMLQQKLVNKYGSKRNPNSKLNQEIEEEVSAFTARTKQQPKDDDFLELENAIRELRAKFVKGGRGSEMGSRGSDGCGRRDSAASGCGGGTRGSSKRGDRGSDGGGGQSGSGDGDGESEGLPLSIARVWRTFDVAKQIEYETKEQEKAEKARQQKIMRVLNQKMSSIFKRERRGGGRRSSLAVREELERHRAQQAKKKLAEEEERRKHMEEQDKRLADFHKEQEAIKKRAADRHAEEKKLREEQVKFLQAEKEKERQARLEKERQDIELCKAQLQGEADEVERKRKAEKDRLATIQAENAKQREIRAQRQRESDEADAALLREHRRRIDAEEQARAANFKQRMKRYEEIGNFWSERQAGKTGADLEQREEQQTLKAARRQVQVGAVRKEEETQERERKEREARRIAGMSMAAENQKVIQEKKALSAKKHKEDMEFAQRFINDSEAFRQEERDKIIKKRIAMAKYRKDLEIQVQETKARRIHEDMNDTEYRMNSDLVKKLEADKNLVRVGRE